MKKNSMYYQKRMVFGVVFFLLTLTGVCAADPYVEDEEVTLAVLADSGGLQCSYTLGDDANSTGLSSATAWYKDGQPIMVMYLPFEGGQDNAVLDFSGNSNSATANGDPTWLNNGGHDGHGAYEFDGVDDYLDAGEIFPTSSSYTKTAWIYRPEAAGFYNIISGYEHSAGTHCFQVFGNRLTAGHNANSISITDATGTLSDNTWYFVAVTYDYSSGTLTLYKNGIAVSSGTIDAEYQDVTDSGVLVGSLNSTYLWNGKIDDARIYNYVLSADQIRFMYEYGQDTIAASEVSENEEWTAYVTSFNSTQAGVTVSSNVFTVGDDDSDGWMNDEDNCPSTYNPEQEDEDEDGIGDVCEVDTDDDGIIDDEDNCPDTYNPDQEDLDGDGTGDVCDSDADGDNVDDVDEQGPDGDEDYDGNGDGTADRLQSNVVSGYTYDGNYYVTLALTSPTDATLANVEMNELPADAPDGFDLPYGVFAFTIEDLAEAGDPATVTINLPDGETPDTYYKYGRTADDTSNHWYEFMYDETTQTGAVIDGNVITLYFVDGARGDDDLTADGTITDDGAPGTSSSSSGGGGGGGGCFISTVDTQAGGAVQGDILMLLFVLMAVPLVRLEAKQE